MGIDERRAGGPEAGSLQERTVGASDQRTGEVPKRVRRSRREKLPEGAVYVGRPTRWGNPFPLDGDWIMWTAVSLGYYGGPSGRRATAVALYRAWLTDGIVSLGPFVGAEGGGVLVFANGTECTLNDHVMGLARFAATELYEAPTVPAERPDLEALRGQDLACWCPLDEQCHADVLLGLANG